MDGGMAEVNEKCRRSTHSGSYGGQTDHRLPRLMEQFAEDNTLHWHPCSYADMLSDDLLKKNFNSKIVNNKHQSIKFQQRAYRGLPT